MTRSLEVAGEGSMTVSVSDVSSSAVVLIGREVESFSECLRLHI